MPDLVRVYLPFIPGLGLKKKKKRRETDKTFGQPVGGEWKVSESEIVRIPLLPKLQSVINRKCQNKKRQNLLKMESVRIVLKNPLKQITQSFGSPDTMCCGLNHKYTLPYVPIAIT